MMPQFLTLTQAAQAAKHEEKNSWPWGTPWLDMGTGGQVAGSVSIIAADTGVGKSFMSLHLASVSPFPSLIVSLEESAAEVGRRASHLPAQPKSVFVYAPDDYVFAELLEAIRVAHREHDIRSVYIDYMQLLDYDGARKYSNRTEEIRALMLDLRHLAKELHIAVVVAAQLKEVPQGFTREEPDLRDLADSVSIKRLAWSVMMLWSVEGVPGLVEAKVKKSKRTAAGMRQFFVRSNTGLLSPIPASQAKQMISDADAEAGDDEDNF
jgi:replicative DNA helicase